MKNFIHTMKIYLSLLGDGFIIMLPLFCRYKQSYRFAFIVHPRDVRDIYRRFPVLRLFPKRFVLFFERWMWPAVVAKITGLKDEQGKNVDGFVVSIPMTASQMLSDRPRAIARIRTAVQLAKCHGARLVGLGALTSSLTHGGMLLKDIPDIGITTGHAFTGYSVSETILSFIRLSGIPIDQVRVGIVGAAGSVGTITTQLLARAGVRNFVLIDLKRKQGFVDTLIDNIQRQDYPLNITSSDDLNLLRDCAFVVTATNATGAVVHKEHIVSGTIIVDDAQPSDIDEDLFTDQTVIVAAAGAIYTPGIHTHFALGLVGKEDNYCCLAEVLSLASVHREECFVLNRPTLAMVDEVAIHGKRLGFTIAKYQNEKGYLDTGHIEHVLELARLRHKQQKI